MTYQPKSVDKMTDFETLTLCISLNVCQMCAYFCKKNSIPNRCPLSQGDHCPENQGNQGKVGKNGEGFNGQGKVREFEEKRRNVREKSENFDRLSEPNSSFTP